MEELKNLGKIGEGGNHRNHDPALHYFGHFNNEGQRAWFLF